MSRVAILQSNYIPWKGYFDLINSVDHFVIYDTAQYTKNDWRNRNKIKARGGLQWLTVPVSKDDSGKAIKDVKVSNQIWRKKHWANFQQYYSKAPFFFNMAERFRDFYLDDDRESLSSINIALIKLINDILGIKTIIHRSQDFVLADGKSEKLLGICRDLEAKVYLSGPAAKDYLDVELFESLGVRVEWMSYQGYPEYRQLFPPFEHGVTILDLLFNEGPEARTYMKSFR